MRKGLAFSVGLCALAAGSAPTVGAAPPKTRAAVLAISWGSSGGGLRLLDARSLKPRTRSRVSIGQPPISASARSPDGRTFVLGSGTGGQLRFVDLRRMRARGSMPIGSGYVATLLWLRPDRLIAVLGGEQSELVLVDPLARRVLVRRDLQGTVSSVAATRARLVLLLTTPGRIAASRIAVVDELGGVRTTTLAEIRAGWQRAGDDRSPYREERPALAADPGGETAFVIPAYGPFAEIELRTLSVTYHNLHTRSLAAAQRSTKSLEGYVRTAVWLGGRVAVSGTDYTSSVEASGQRRQQSRAAGLVLVDLRDWTVRDVGEPASALALAGDTLLVFGTSWDSGTQRSTGMGISGYGRDGTRRFHLFGQQPVGYLQTAGRLAYEGSNNSTVFRVFDVRTGLFMGRATTPLPTIFLG